MFTLDLNDLTTLLESTTGAAPLRCEPMPGGASSRKFFRVSLAPTAKTNGTRTAVAMFVPDLDKSDEIAKATTQRRWPYLEVRDLLAERGIRVPALIADGTDRGWTVVEDLGDETVAVHLERHAHRKELIYQTAVRDLAHAQRKLEQLPADSIVRTRAFDYDLLRWEIDHFREWGLDALGRSLPAEPLRQFNEIADRLARRVAELPRGFVHRDYQSRNLMVTNATDEHAELAWVDFQDALLGPWVYDLVALLNDSYQTFSRAFVEQRLAEYVEHRGLGAEQLPAIIEQFDLVTVQRKLKDAGRFVFIDRVKGDASYLQFVEPTLAKVRMSLERLQADEDMARLGQILAPVLP